MSKARELAELGAVYDSGALSNRNLFINGAMTVSQRGTSDASISDNEFVVDRYSLRTSNAGWYAAEQSTDAPTGFSNSLKITSNGANSPAAGAYIFFAQKIEGFNSAHLEFGTSNAKTITISFHIKSSLTGTFGGSLRNSAQNRSYPFSFTISSANTWEYKTVTIAGDTTGTWIGSTNGIGLDVIFNLGSGTNNQGTAGAWAAAGYLKPTGAVNLVETSGATLFLTGLQLELGTEATPFEHRSFGQELALCSRYFQAYTGATQEWVYNESNLATGKWWQLIFPNGEMRTSPTVSFGSGWLGGTLAGQGSNTIDSMSCSSSNNRTSCRVTMSSTGGTAYNLVHTDGFDTRKCFMDAEL